MKIFNVVDLETHVESVKRISDTITHSKEPRIKPAWF